MDQDDIRRVVQRQDEIFTEDALRAQDGKVVPLTLEQGGPVIGAAFLTYNSEAQALEACFRIDNPKVAEALRADPPSIFKKES